MSTLTRVAGRYELVRPLGHGAMATVDLAHDVELDRPVALKRLAENLARDEDLQRRFLREARLAARLAHPNVVRVFDVGEDGGRPFIAMEYVEGETLAELMARRGRLPAGEAATLGMQMCAGLAAAHAAGLVHRDVKPQNLLLGTDGVLKLGDFGVAVGHEGTRLTLAGTVLGTAGYLAPEQARGERVTAAADIYAVGAVLYELLTGEPSRTAGSLAELGAEDGFEPPDLAARVPATPPELVAAVTACLSARPENRPPTARRGGCACRGCHRRSRSSGRSEQRRRPPVATELDAAWRSAAGKGDERRRPGSQHRDLAPATHALTPCRVRARAFEPRAGNRAFRPA